MKRVVVGEFMLRNIKPTIFLASEKCNMHHTCGENNLCSRGHPRADAYWVANVVEEKFREEPSHRACTMHNDLRRYYAVELDYCRLRKGKELAMHDIHDTYEGCYDRLR